MDVIYIRSDTYSISNPALHCLLVRQGNAAWFLRRTAHYGKDRITQARIVLSPAVGQRGRKRRAKYMFKLLKAKGV
jgi:hypothetical protein